MNNIAVIGDGGWGTTLAILLQSKGFKVKLWGAFADYIEEVKKTRQNRKFLPGVKIPREVYLCAEIEEVLNKSDGVILAVPSQFLRNVIGKIDSRLIAGAIVVSVIKGIEENSLLRISQVVEEVWGEVKLGVLSGPTIAYEVARGVPTSAVVSAKEQAVANTLQDLFITDKFRIYTVSDLIGVELGGALKNIVAIAAGISDGLGFGTNA
jgi:glycerol-3-phosphate dehydrogenase (NAD(P)+)